jgi:F5/8 type C domain
MVAASPAASAAAQTSAPAAPPAAAAALPAASAAGKTLRVAAPAQVVAPGFTASASSFWPGWPVTNATDGDVGTSWYSAGDDAAAFGKAPYFQIELATPQAVRRVTILGNRDPAYLVGYTILAGRLELFDAKGRVILARESEGTGNLRDFDFALPERTVGVKVVRFTSIDDEGDQNAYHDVAIAEMQVE